MSKFLVNFLILICFPACAQTADDTSKAQATAHLHALLDAAPKAILNRNELPIQAPRRGWELGTSLRLPSIQGSIYLLQRGERPIP